MATQNKRGAIASVLRAKRRGAVLTPRGERVLSERQLARVGSTLVRLVKQNPSLLTARGRRTLAELIRRGFVP